MVEPKINNEGSVQGQNYAQYQRITQIFHDIKGEEAFFTKQQRAWNASYKRDFLSDESISDYEYAIQLDLAAMHAHTGKGDALTKLKWYKEAITAYEYAISTYKHAIKLDPTYIHAQSTLEKDPLEKSHQAPQTSWIDFKKTYRIILTSFVYISSLLFLSLGIIWFDFYLFSLFFTKNPSILKLCTYNAISFMLLAMLIITYAKATKIAFGRIASILKESFGNV
jgi:tetratricopeptide (TPR) repeat protein